MKRTALGLSPWILAALLLVHCAPLDKQAENAPVWQDLDDFIKVVRDTGPQKALQQPRTFSLEQMERILFSLFFSRYQYFRWDTPGQVFKAEDAIRLAPYFRKAFQETGHDEWVVFYLTNKKEKFRGLIGRLRLTRGSAFIRDNRIHFRFSDVERIIMDDYNDFDELAPYRPPVAWKIVPADGQGYGGNAQDKEVQDLHWIWIDLDRLAAFPVPELPETQAAEADKQKRELLIEEDDAMTDAIMEVPASQMDPGAVQERLRHLKQLLDQGLITQQDYDNKKNEILKDL